MTNRDRWLSAAIFACVWVPLMFFVWWVGALMTQVLVGGLLVLNDVPPGLVISRIPDRTTNIIFAVIGFGGLVLGCLSCRYGPDLSYPPPPQPDPQARY